MGVGKNGAGRQKPRKKGEREKNKTSMEKRRHVPTTLKDPQSHILKQETPYQKSDSQVRQIQFGNIGGGRQ